MEELYLKILEAFENNTQLFYNAGLNPPRQIDLHRGQPDDEGAEIFLPAIFVDIRITASNTDPGPDATTVSVHILMDNGPGTENYSYNREDGLKYLQFIKVVKKILNKLVSEATSRLEYAGEEAVQTAYMRYIVVNYTCNTDRYTDSIHSRQVTKAAKPAPEIAIANE